MSTDLLGAEIVKCKVLFTKVLLLPLNVYTIRTNLGVLLSGSWILQVIDPYQVRKNLSLLLRKQVKRIVPSSEIAKLLFFFKDAVMDSPEGMGLSIKFALERCIFFKLDNIVNFTESEMNRHLQTFQKYLLARDDMGCCLHNGSLSYDQMRKVTCSLGCLRKVQKKLFKCGRCLSARYCSSDCQNVDWSRHKLECKSMRMVHMFNNSTL
jgi:hypothetical protein